MEYKTSVFYAGGGSEYTFPFEYLQKSFVKVRYQKPDGAFKNLEFGKDYNVEENRVTLTTASDSADKVNIYRSTPTDRMVKYVDASILKAHDMNVNELQTLHIMEEQTDYLSAYALFRGDNANVWEANTLRIINLAAPLEPTDAVNKAYVDEYGVSWNQNVAQMKQQLQEQNTNIATQLDTQNKAVTKQLSAQQTAIDTQLKNQSDDFENRISTHDTELLNKVDANNQKYKTDLETYNNKIVQHIHDDAGASAELSKKWAQDKGSPDNASDSVSSTGKTQSSKTWAGVAKSQAQASAASAAAALASQKAAKTSETNAKTSETNANTYSSAALASQNAAKTSETNAKTSEENAAESARQAAAGQINSDWNETDESSQAFIKNKPNVVTKTELANSVSTKDLSVTGETSVPTASAGNSSKAIANTEFVQGELTNYLPLRGGTMTGAITTSAIDFIKKTSNTSHVTILGGTESSNSASLMVAGGSQSYATGCFELKAQDGSNSSALTGKPDGTLTWKNQPLLPVGVVQAFAGSTIPNGWLLCDGSAVSRTDYAALHAVIGTTYGAGNGSTTFNLPNLTDKFIQGSATSGTVKSAGLPNITGRLSTGGKYGFDVIWNDDTRGAFNTSTAVQYGWQATTQQVLVDSKFTQANFDASLSNAIYGNSNTVQPPALTMRYIIKY